MGNLLFVCGFTVLFFVISGILGMLSGILLFWCVWLFWFSCWPVVLLVLWVGVIYKILFV